MELVGQLVVDVAQFALSTALLKWNALLAFLAYWNMHSKLVEVSSLHRWNS